MHKIKTGTLKAGSVKSSSRETFEMSVARDNVLSFMSSVKGTPEYWKLERLEIPTYFLTLPCADLRQEKLPYIINKLNKPRTT